MLRIGPVMLQIGQAMLQIGQAMLQIGPFLTEADFSKQVEIRFHVRLNIFL